MVNSAHFATNHVWSKDAYPLFSLPLFSANWSDKVPVVGSPSHETLWAIVTVGFQFVQGVCLWMSCAVWKCKNQIEQWMCIHIADINLWKNASWFCSTSCRHVQHCQSINSHTFPMPMRAETLCWWLLAYLVLTAPDECFRNSSVPRWSNLWVMQHVKSDLPLVCTCPHPKVKQLDAHEIPPFEMQQNVSWIVNQSSLPRSRYTMVHGI